MTDEEYVGRNWERAEACPRGYGDEPVWVISLGGRADTRANVPYPDAKTEAEAWAAARAFTEERLEQIRLVEEEIEQIEDDIEDTRIHIPENIEAYKRILARETAALTELKRGLRPESRREQ